jgi:hypothetical protein
VDEVLLSRTGEEKEKCREIEESREVGAIVVEDWLLMVARVRLEVGRPV